MAVVSLMNQSRFKRAYIGSRERINHDVEGIASGHDHVTVREGLCKCHGLRITQRISDIQRVTINVSGQYFETWSEVLERHPLTLLGDPRKREKYFDKHRNEYFFDRHRPTFEAIFHYYMYGGRLRRPEPVPDDIFLEELEFFEIESELVDIYKREEGYIAEKIVLPERGWQRKVWLVMEHPDTSCIAYIIAIMSVIVTVVSIILFCVETLPVFKDKYCKTGHEQVFHDPFFVIETLCTIWFTAEVFIRFGACPSKIGYFKDFKNLVDIAAVIPYYITFFNIVDTMTCGGDKTSSSLAFLRVVRLVRVFKLTKHSAGLQVLLLTFKASFGGLCLFLVALIVCILLFSSAIYYAEVGIEDSNIHSIPDGFWWSVITMTTVGYGDKYPMGPLGKFIGCICAIAGVLTLAIPVPIITENFNKFYAHKVRGKMG